MVDRFNSGLPEYVPVKWGHTSDEFNRRVAEELGIPPSALMGENGGGDGVASLGRVVGLRRVQNKLVADFEVAEPMADMVGKGALRDVSIELINLGGDLTLSAVAWLGAERPAVSDLKGLAAAAVLKRSQAPAFAFRRAVADVHVEPLDESTVARIAERVRSMFQREQHKENEEMDLGKEVRKLFGGKSDEEILAAAKQFQEDEDEGGEEEEAEVTASPFDGATTAAIKAILGVGMDASGDEVLGALRSLLALPDNAAPEEIGAELMKRAKAPQSFSQSREYREMSDKLTRLERRDRIASFRAETASLTAVQGTPDELAEKLVDIEDKGGAELARSVLDGWHETQKYADQAGVTARIGHNREPSQDHDWVKRVTEYAKEKGITFALAQVELAKSDPKAFAAYRDESRQAV
jgi:hypothetical protein